MRGGSVVGSRGGRSRHRSQTSGGREEIGTGSCQVREDLEEAVGTGEYGEIGS